MGLREFVELFDKNEVKNLFNALSSCIEYVRIDFSNPGENEQVAYFINYCLNQDKDGKE